MIESEIRDFINDEIMDRHKKLMKSGWNPFRIGMDIIYYSQRFGIALNRTDAYIKQISFETFGEL